MEKRKIISFINTTSQYNVLNYFKRDINESFRKLGYQVEEIDSTYSFWVQKLKKLIQTNEILFMWDLNAIDDITVGDEHQSLYDATNIPFFLYLVDSPSHLLQFPEFRDQISRIRNMVISCVDRGHIKTLRTHSNLAFTKVFIPHGAPTFYEKNSKSIKSREIDILFLGSNYGDPEKHRHNWLKYSPEIKNLLELISEEAITSFSKESIEDIIERTLNREGIFYENIKTENYILFINEIDKFLRKYVRFHIIKSLSSDFDIHVYGNGWGELSNQFGNRCIIHPAVDYQQSIELMGNAKIVLNINPTFHYGGHERLYTSMIQGAVCLTTSNQYIKNSFKDKENLLNITYTDLEHSKSTIGKLLENLTELQAIADSGKNLALSNHTWFNRAQKIIEVVKLHRTLM